MKKLLLKIEKDKNRILKKITKSYQSRWTRDLNAIRAGKGRTIQIEKMYLPLNWKYWYT